MKIGAIEIKLAEKVSKKPDTGEEVGATGTTFFSGSLSENEYNTDLRGSKAIVVYDKMRRSDSRVKATLSACFLPIRAADWSITPASEDKRDEEIAQGLENNLFEGMSITWDSFLYHILLMLVYGWFAFEKVWLVEDGQYRWQKLAPRLPSTLYKWELDTTGGLKGITQFVMKDNKYEFVDIPVDKLLVFTNDKEGSNFEGISILRSAYQNWYYKSNLYRIDGIAAERHALGLPSFKHPADAKKEDKDRIDEIGQRLYAHEQAYIRLAEGYEFKVEGLSGTIKDIMPSIEHHNREIAGSILADFLALGTGAVGSWALSRDKSSFFLMALESVIKNICDTFNRYAIKQWVDFNYSPVEQYPKLTASSLERRAIAEYSKAVTDLVTAGVLGVDAGVEDTLRDLLNLPPKAEATKQSEKRLFKGAESFRRELTMAEEFVALREIDKKLDTAEEQLIKAASAVQKRQIDKLTEVALKIIEKKQLDRLDDIDVPFRAEMTVAINEVLLDIYAYGRKQVRDELEKQAVLRGAEPWPEPLGVDDVVLIKEFLKARAKVNANLLAIKLKSAITFEALRQIRQGIVDKAAISGVLGDLSDRGLIATAQASVTEAFGFGRSNEAEKHKDEIVRVQYSAILDENVCAVCEPLDGEEWEFEDTRTDKYARGNPDCDGRTRCRCLILYISRAERRGR